MSLTSEAAEGMLSSYLANEQRKGANEVDLANEKAMLDFNTLNQHQKPLDRSSHLLSGLLSIYGSNPELYGKTDWSKFGDLGPAGVTREDMTYAKAPLLKPGGTGGGTSKGKSLLSGLLKGAAGALANKDAAKNDAFGRAANAAGGSDYDNHWSGGEGAPEGRTQFLQDTVDQGGRGQFLQEDGSYGPTEDFSGSGNDDYDFYSQNENLFNGSQGGPQEQMQQGSQDSDADYDQGGDYDYDGDYGD